VHSKIWREENIREQQNTVKKRTVGELKKCNSEDGSGVQESECEGEKRRKDARR
jgi:hypothetical protein